MTSPNETNRPVEIGQGDKEALSQDVLLSIPAYLHSSIFKAFARHAASSREEGARRVYLAAVEAIEQGYPTPAHKECVHGTSRLLDCVNCYDEHLLAKLNAALSIVGEGD